MATERGSYAREAETRRDNGGQWGERGGERRIVPRERKREREER